MKLGVVEGQYVLSPASAGTPITLTIIQTIFLTIIVITTLVIILIVTLIIIAIIAYHQPNPNHHLNYEPPLPNNHTNPRCFDPKANP